MKYEDFGVRLRIFPDSDLVAWLDARQRQLDSPNESLDSRSAVRSAARLSYGAGIEPFQTVERSRGDYGA